MSEPQDEVLTALRELRSDVSALKSAQAELANARTDSQEQQARADVREAKDDLETHARALGLTRGEVEALQRTKQKDTLRELLDEIIEERLAQEQEAAGEDEAKEKKSKRKANVRNLKDARDKAAKGEEVVTEEDPKPDIEPVAEQKSWASRLAGN